MSTRVPPYCRQRETSRPDRAFVRINGRKIFLGQYGSPESKARYAEVISARSASQDERAGGGQPDHPPTISGLLVQFLEWANSYYDSREYGHFLTVVRFLRQYGSTPANDFGPRLLMEVRDGMIDQEWSRKSINRQVVRVRQIFSWAATQPDQASAVQRSPKSPGYNSAQLQTCLLVATGYSLKRAT